MTPRIRPLVGWSVRHNFVRVGSYTFMHLSEHLFVYQIKDQLNYFKLFVND